MSTEKPKENAVAEKEMEFVPFANKDAIKLSVNIVKRLICVPTKNGHKCSDEEAMKFMLMCRAKGLNPFEQDAFLIGYDTQDGPKFSLITAHQAFLKRAECNPEYDGMESGVMVTRDGKTIELEGDFHFENDVLVGGWATVHFKNRKHPMKKRIRLARFNTGKSQWAKDPAGMICKCAEADALRSSFPTLLGGLYTREEMDKDTTVDTTPSKPMFKTIDLPPEDARKSEPQDKPLVVVRRLCESRQINEITMVNFMKDVGLADDKSTKLEEQSDKNLTAVINGWEDFSSRIKLVEV